jgi:hypothetical protein
VKRPDSRRPAIDAKDLEAAEAVFGTKEFMPLSRFTAKIGLDRKTVLQLVAGDMLEVYQYSPGTYRKLLVSKTSFIRFLKATSLRKCS